MEIIYKNKKIKIPVKKVSSFGKITGLMFRSNKTENLLFEFKEKTKIHIHSYFVFFDFLVIWLNEKNKVVEFKYVNPFYLSIKSKKPFSKLIEIPLNNKNKEITKFFVGRKDLNIIKNSVI